MRMAFVVTAAILTVLQSAQAQDVGKGQKSFNKCVACHTVGANATNKTGPVLNNVVGRKAGMLEGFSYSPAMTDAGKAGLLWDEQTLAKYITNPRVVVPGTRMTFGGIKKASEVADLIAYLKSMTKP